MRIRMDKTHQQKRLALAVANEWSSSSSSESSLWSLIDPGTSTILRSAALNVFPCRVLCTWSFILPKRNNNKISRIHFLAAAPCAFEGANGERKNLTRSPKVSTTKRPRVLCDQRQTQTPQNVHCRSLGWFCEFFIASRFSSWRHTWMYHTSSRSSSSSIRRRISPFLVTGIPLSQTAHNINSPQCAYQ